MKPLRFTLVGDGSSDQALVPVINWSIERVAGSSNRRFDVEFAGDFYGFKPKSLKDKVAASMAQFPCDLLFVHRDAEREDRTRRVDEIEEACRSISLRDFIPVVPVRMTEAWLLIDESAIRMAADNPNGSAPIQLPPVKKLEGIPDPKELSNNLLIEAPEKQGRRLAKFRTPSELSWRRYRVAQQIGHFESLLDVPAFSEFHKVVERKCRSLFNLP